MILYLIQVAADDEETQKQGLVLITTLLKKLPPLHKSLPTDSVDDGPSRWSTLSRVLSRIFRCAPLRVGALHVCSPHDHDVKSARTDLLNDFSVKERVRTRFHKGTSMEISMALNAYGIPTDRLPLKYDGTVKIEDHLQWIAVREAKEEAFRAGRVFDVVECPMNMDVLSGR